MNRVHWMRLQVGFVLAVTVPMVACHTNTPNSASSIDGSGAPAPAAQYTLSGGVFHPGPRDLHGGDTVGTIVARELAMPPGKPITIVLIRQAPEGKTRQLIQLDADGHLMDPKQDWALRNGDELEFPGGTGSNSTRNPTGPPPRAAE